MAFGSSVRLWHICFIYLLWKWDTTIDCTYSNGRLTWGTFSFTQVNKCNYDFIHSSIFDLLWFLMSDVLPFTARWGSSVQHSHWEHPGCREARGGVIQDEKCKGRHTASFCDLSILLKLFWFFAHFLSPFFPRSDVPGHSTRARTLHPGQQLCRGPRLDRHLDQSQSVQPQTLKHLPPFRLPQRPLALLQALSRRSPRVYALHRVRLTSRMCPESSLCPLLPLTHPPPACFCFQRPPCKHPAGRRRRQRDGEDLLPVQHIHDQTDQDARSDTGKSCVVSVHVYL